LFCGLTALAPPLPGQTPTTGSIDGTVEDSNGSPLPGVSLQARSPSLQGSRIAVSDAAGRFHLLALPPGTYRLAATRPGFESVERNDIKVSLSETATVPVVMRVAVAASVLVSGETPVVDVTSNTGGLDVRFEIIQKLPTGRNYATIVAIHPGVNTDNAETQGVALPFTIYGSTSIENQYLVDGANTTNVIKGFQGKAIPQEFVEEVQLKASGYDAEYGRATGGIINVVTKSGGNEFHGDVFGYFNRKGLTAASKASADTDQNTVIRVKEDRADYGLDLGGFFLKDRIWFFGAYNRVDRNQDQVPLAGTGLPNAGVNLPLDFSSNLFSGKLTFRLAGSTTLVGTVFGDPEGREGTLRNFTSDDPAIREGIREIGGTDYAVSLLQLFGATGLANARYARHRDRYQLSGQANGVQYLDLTVDPTNPIVSGGFGYIDGATDNNASTRNAWKLDGSLFLGSHEIKAGVDHERTLTETRS
jgi:hypothetical protein